MLSVDDDRELAELQAYLGSTYDHRRLQRYAAQLEEELGQVGEEATFYRTSEGYLYNLTAFALTHTKDPYLAWIPQALGPGAAVLDVGCGIGSDGLVLLEGGYRVTFADFDNPSTRYLRWRLQRRGLRAPVIDLDAEPLPRGFDLAYAFDVIEHVPDPFAFLAQLERVADLVLVNFLEPEPEETALHHPLPIDALLAHVTRRGLLRYARLHGGRSHLVLYRPGRPWLPGRLRARLARMAPYVRRGQRRRRRP